MLSSSRRTSNLSQETSSDDEEHVPMIVREGSVDSKDDNTQQETILTNGVLNLHSVVVITAWILSIAMLVFLIALFDPDLLFGSYSISFYCIFGILWIGHCFVYVCIFRILQKLYSTLASQRYPHRAELWLDNNEQWIPIIIFIAVSCAHILFNSTLLLLSEILLFMFINNVVNSSIYFLVPLYVLFGTAILTSICCKSESNVIVSLTSCCLLIALVMFTLKTETKYSTELTWYLTFIPLYVLFLGWLILFTHILTYYLLGIYKLKISQVISLSLYITSTVFYIISIYFIIAYFDFSADKTYNLQLSTLSAVFASCCLMVAVSLDVTSNLQLTLDRMGGGRPKVIKRVFHMPTASSFAARRNSSTVDDTSCGWDEDRLRNYRTFVILGEIEMNPQRRNNNNHNGSSSSRSPSTHTRGGEDGYDSCQSDVESGSTTSSVDDAVEYARLNRSLLESFFFVSTSCCQSTVEMLLFRRTRGRYYDQDISSETNSESSSQYGTAASYYSSDRSDSSSSSDSGIMETLR